MITWAFSLHVSAFFFTLFFTARMKIVSALFFLTFTLGTSPRSENSGSSDIQSLKEADDFSISFDPPKSVDGESGGSESKGESSSGIKIRFQKVTLATAPEQEVKYRVVPPSPGTSDAESPKVKLRFSPFNHDSSDSDMSQVRYRFVSNPYMSGLDADRPKVKNRLTPSNPFTSDRDADRFH